MRTTLSARRLPAAGALALTTLAVTATTALGAAGDLDPSFGKGGMTVYGQIPSATVETLVQPDGKLVRVDVEAGAKNFTVRRFNADGSPDREFGEQGLAVADFGGADLATGAALQPDGKLVVAGRTTEHPVANAASVVARFDGSGDLDPSFAPGGTDGDGKLIVPESFYDTVEAVVIKPGGDIGLVGARAIAVPPQEPVSTDQAWIRLLESNGAPGDMTYDYALLDGADTAQHGTVAADGSALVAGTTRAGDVTNLALVRWTPAGKLDPTLGGTGKLSLPLMSEVADLIALPDGRFLVAGTTKGPDHEAVLARFKQDGTPDASFGNGGVARLPLQGDSFAIAAALQSDGKVLAVGGSNTELLVGVVRFTTGGVPDPTYGQAGIARPFAGQLAGVYDGALATDGKLVLAGAGLIAGTPGALVARLLADPPPVTGGRDPVPGGDPGPALDTQAPAVSGPKVTRTVAGKRPRIAFTLSEPAQVRLVLERRGARVQRFARRGVAGANRVRAPRKLRRDRYRLTIVATDAAGNASAPARIRFRMR